MYLLRRMSKLILDKRAISEFYSPLYKVRINEAKIKENLLPPLTHLLPFFSRLQLQCAVQYNEIFFRLQPHSLPGWTNVLVAIR